jgi:hypothetical protein
VQPAAVWSRHVFNRGKPQHRFQWQNEKIARGKQIVAELFESWRTIDELKRLTPVKYRIPFP